MQIPILHKGSTIDVLATQPKLCIGVNWGAIVKKKRFLGLVPTWEGVNLDLGAALFDEQGEMLDLIYPNKPHSKDGAISHSGDDTTGDKTLSSDQNDNETIVLDLTRLNPSISQLFFFVQSSSQTDFSDIPYTQIRIYTASAPNQVENLLGSFDVAANAAFHGKVAMVMGKLFRRGQDWRFYTIGEGVEAAKLLNTVALIKERYL
ncbi:TerD family protein [Hugenholtzia roseola]|uniref:TerD family protein n=1 Tax=Hugenholtzia roseola TaxID=1002 RepID=UPI0004290E37|nr:TerD family protein [Hugenholtzia roseola]